MWAGKKGQKSKMMARLLFWVQGHILEYSRKSAESKRKRLTTGSIEVTVPRKHPGMIRTFYLCCRLAWPWWWSVQHVRSVVLLMRKSRAQRGGATRLGSQSYLRVNPGLTAKSPHLPRCVSIPVVGSVACGKHVEIYLCNHVVPCLRRTADSKNVGHKSTWGLCPICISFGSICPVLTRLWQLC